MGRHRRKRGRPRSTRLVRIRAERRAEEEIDRRELALALLAFQERLAELRRRREGRASSKEDPEPTSGEEDEGGGI